MGRLHAIIAMHKPRLGEGKRAQDDEAEAVPPGTGALNDVSCADRHYCVAVGQSDQAPSCRTTAALRSKWRAGTRVSRSSALASKATGW